jgi:hypothetical protein
MTRTAIMALALLPLALSGCGSESVHQTVDSNTIDANAAAPTPEVADTNQAEGWDGSDATAPEGERIVTAAELEEREQSLKRCLEINVLIPGETGRTYDGSRHTLAELEERWPGGTWEWVSAGIIYRFQVEDEMTHKRSEIAFLFKENDKRRLDGSCTDGDATLSAVTVDNEYVSEREMLNYYAATIRGMPR